MKKLTNEELIRLITADSDQDTSDSSIDDIKRQKIELESGSEQEWEDLTIDESILHSNNVSDEINIKLHTPNPRKPKSNHGFHRYILNLITYTTHGFMRNQWLNDENLQKKIKKNIPSKLMKRIKSFNKRQVDKGELTYILKYMIKWFKLNFKLKANGIRPSFKDIKDGTLHISDINQYTTLAKTMQGNRDNCSQFLTCFLRSLGWDSRLVFSIPLHKIIQATNRQPTSQRFNSFAKYDEDLLFPYFWTELVSPVDDSEVYVIDTLSFINEDQKLTKMKRYGGTTELYFPQGSFNTMEMHYVVAYGADYVLDVSSRYMRNIAYRYFNTIDLKSSSGKILLFYKNILNCLNRGEVDQREIHSLNAIGLKEYDIPKTFSMVKQSPIFTTTVLLQYNEIINTEPICMINVPKIGLQPVYLKNQIIKCKSKLQWKFLGRSILPNEKPMIVTNTRPKTIRNKRQFNENIINQELDKNEMEMFSYSQTEVIEVDTLGINEYGNVEIFQKWMVPPGYIWIKLRKIEQVMKLYNSKSEFKVWYVDVVSGFEFKSGKAYPIKHGVLIEQENEILTKQIWLKEMINLQKQQIINKETKALQNWKNLLIRLRIKSRLDKY